MKTNKNKFMKVSFLMAALLIGVISSFASNGKHESKMFIPLNDKMFLENIFVNLDNVETNRTAEIPDSSKTVLQKDNSSLRDTTIVSKINLGITKKGKLKKSKATSYFHYTGTSTSLSSYQNAANWNMVSDPDDPGCDEGSKPCVVQSTLNSVSAFVASISQISDVTDNTIRTKN